MSENTESELPAGGEGAWPRVTVTNFGPIATADVELRPLTVFVGPSNTGKSWLATLIYAMAREINAGYVTNRLLRRFRSDMAVPDDTELANFPADPAAWLQSLEDDQAWRLTAGEKHALETVLAGQQEMLQEAILRCFGLAKAHDLVREGNAGGATVTFVNAVTPYSFSTSQRLAIDGQGRLSLDVDVFTDECRPSLGSGLDLVKDALEALLRNLTNANPDDEPPSGNLRNPRSHGLRANLLDLLVHRIWESATYYLPADRGGVMHAHQAVVGALIQRASRASLTRSSPLPALSGVLADFLEQLVEFAHYGSDVPSTAVPPADAARSLERTVLGGRIDIETSDVGYPHFTYRPDGWKRDLSLMSVSSMVSELAPVALYLRHCIRQGDLLILEEPEAHLHPAMQVHLVREIAGWVRQGIRVLITTHSEWVIEAIANMVAEAETGKADGLPQRDVGVWRFDMGTRRTPLGSHIREVEWDPNEGGFPAGFGAVAGDLMNAWADLLEDAE